MRLNKTLQFAVNFSRARECIGATPQDMANLIALADKVYSRAVKHANTNTKHTNNAMEAAKCALVNHAVNLGLEVKFPALAPHFYFKGVEIYFPST